MSNYEFFELAHERWAVPAPNGGLQPNSLISQGLETLVDDDEG